MAKEKVPGIILYPEDIERIKKSVKPQYQFAVVYALSRLATEGEYPTEEELGEGGMVAFGFMADKVTEALQKYREVSEKRKVAVSKRWETKESVKVQDDTNDTNVSEGIQTHTNETKTKTETEIEIKKEKQKESNARGVSAKFEIFWKSYPRKEGKGNAEKIFERIKPDDMLFARMLKAVETAKSSPQWTKDGGQFIPHPSTWLNQRRWEDEPMKAMHQKTDYQRREYQESDFKGMEVDLSEELAAMKAAGQ